MRYVRFVPAATPAAAEETQARWGRLEGDAVAPLPDAPWRLSPVQRSAFDGDPVDLAGLRLLAPVEPRKIVCVGRNYAEHAAELGNDVPPEPLLFLKPTSSLLAPDAAVVHPSLSRRVDHEAELAVVVGTGGRFLDEEAAQAAIFAYTVANDVTARDLQKTDGQWARAKGFDTFCPVGPWLDDAFDPAGRSVRCLVNGNVRQESSIDLMIFPVARILSHISMAMRLEPGDLVLTGTPAGVAPVAPGDVMVVEIDGLGALRNPVVDETALRAGLA